MPKINITLTDNTGVDYTGKEQVIFFPGTVEILSGADDNNCVLIDSSKANSLEKIINIKDRSNSELELYRYMISGYLSRGYEVLYHYNASGLGNLSFLKDKDNYNVKFLTAGIHNPIEAHAQAKIELESSKSRAKVAEVVDATVAAIDFSFANHKILVEIARDRKDCVVVSGIDYNPDNLTSAGLRGDSFADCIRASLEKATTVNLDESNDGSNKINITSDYTQEDGEFAYLLVPNRVRSFTKYQSNSNGAYEVTDQSVECAVPAGFAYLMALGYSNINNTQWLPTANSSRGNVDVYGTSDIKMTKYHFDTNIIKDKDCVSFNGIVYLRPYGDVIWGDRTLLKLGSSVKATGYMSLMLVICDIAKEAYNAAVRYTYESNNEVTWLNYKTRITKLLDQMVTAGVLQSYKVAKMATESLNTIVSKITINPNLPVENFEIVVDLQNADLTVSD